MAAVEENHVPEEETNDDVDMKAEEGGEAEADGAEAEGGGEEGGEGEQEADAKEGAEEAPKEEDGAAGKYDPEEMPEEQAKEEKPKEPEPAKELEEDAAEDSRAAVEAGSVSIDSANSTMNAMPSCGGKVLMALSDGGFQYLTAAARANTGLSAGRYLFEVRPVEGIRSYPADSGKSGQRPRQFFSFGFSAASAGPLFIGSCEATVGFDSDGNFMKEGKKSRIMERLNGTHQVFGILLNLDQSSPNANTISLFRDGVRLCQPQSLPEGLKGKALFPAVNYKNFTMNVNFGPEPLAPLPFKCRMLQGAAKADTESIPAGGAGKPEVLFPVGLPDEGTFNWLDGFLKENPKYTELSDRALLKWCERSSITRSKGYDQINSNDRPGMEFGIRELDDGSTRKLVHQTASILNRNYVYMEVRNNLMASERKKSLELFKTAELKKVALVVMGEPPESFKAAAMESLLNAKRAKAENDVKRKRAAEERKKRNDKKRDEAKDGEDDKEEEPEETLEEAVRKAVEAVELTEEEKTQWFKKRGVEDLNHKELAKQYANFTLPSLEEGFDEIRFAWQQADGSASYLKGWIQEKKLTMRVEDLQPGTWFKDKLTEWHDVVQQWKRRQSQWREPPRRKEEVRKKRKVEKQKEEKKPDEEMNEKKESEEGAEKQEEEEVKAEENEENKVEEEKKEEEEEGEEEVEEEPVKVNLDDLDVYAVEDVMDVQGGGEPLFSRFEYEDWQLLSLRCELHLLVHGFRKDLNDVERPSFHESHLGFYYNKYFKKTFNLKQYNLSSSSQLVALVKDAVEADAKSSILETMLSEDTPFENFVKLTEDGRRERQRIVDAGDESAKLKFTRPSDEQGNRGQKGGAQGKGYGSKGGQHGGPRMDSGNRHGGQHHGGKDVGRPGYGRAPPGPPPPGPPPLGRAPLPPPHHGDARMPPGPPGARGAYGGGYGDRGSYGGDRGDHRGGYSSGGGYGGHRGAPPPPAPSRGGGGYGPPPGPPPSRGGYGSHPPPPAPTSAYGGGGGYGGHKRGHGGQDDGRSGHKQARSHYGGGGGAPPPPPSRGGHSRR